MPEEPGGELVEEGSFRLDRSRLLEKLGAFQLKEPKEFMTPFLRCAVASGAARAELRDLNSPPGFELRFDGRPFTRKELADPYQCLLDKEKLRHRRGRQLAYGLLAALRFKPKTVTIASGSGAGRVELRVRSAREEEFVPADPGEDTVIRVRWDRWPKEFAFPSARKVLSAVAAISDCAIPVTAGDWTTETPAAAGKRPSALAFEENAVRGYLEWPWLDPGCGPDKSWVRLHALGVYAETLELQLPYAQVNGMLHDEAFRLDLSQSALVHDERYERAKALVKRWARELLLRELSVQAERAPRTGKLLLDPRFLPYWRARLKGWDAWAALQSDWLRTLKETLPAFLVPGWLARRRYDLPPEAKELHIDGLRTLWLRAAAEKALAPGRSWDELDETERRLLDVPLLFDAFGGGVSLRRLRDWPGLLPYTHAPRPGESDPRRWAVWITCEQDLFFFNTWFIDRRSFTR